MKTYLAIYKEFIADQIGAYPSSENQVSVTKDFPPQTSQEEVTTYFQSLSVPRVMRDFKTSSEHFYAKEIIHVYAIARELEFEENRSKFYKVAAQSTCPPKFKKKCPLNWESLTALPDTADRWCTHCRKRVHRTDDPNKLYQLSQNGKCVAVLYEHAHLLGDLDYEYYKKQKHYLTDQKLS